MNGDIRDNVARSRFELEIDGQVVFANYDRRDATLVIRYVEAPPALRGTGAADALMRGIVDIARTEGRTLMPLCSYASVWLRRHREFHDLVGG
ncbi:GNAT family N-acetyltransferase [Microvirga rosea]|uniref:GNAT family N-acetyltransferase n=1 Tax=Microvirga rosea TaxID=2715425 RepID=UPI001D0BAF9F|nr:GNAT family N-acetyltransferase [Microvirga rosea]MCB8819792.1 N-acetyltransferase [Microvirga rosea]